MRVGIFGGTFNPPHLGHLILASEAQYQRNLDAIYLVVTPDPPHKTDQTIIHGNIRAEMVKAAIQGYPEFVFSDIEFNRPGPHYAVDTVKEFRREFPGSIIGYLVGGDSLNDLPTWHDPTGFVRECDEVIVMNRIGEPAKWEVLIGPLPELRDKTYFLNTPLIDISSNDIRSRIKDHRPWKTFVSPGVEHIINKHQLYR
jgi:nicotinate-nucleotide adenylyltransferase